jgi:hypothetical protein
MRIRAEEFETMRAWFAVLVPEVFPAAAPETDPLAVLNAIAGRAPAGARDGLAMAIGDMIEMTAMWPPEKVAALDARLTGQGLPSFSDVRVRFSKAVHRALRRGGINGETEYHAVRNAAEMWQGRQAELWALLAAYEARAAG